MQFLVLLDSGRFALVEHKLVLHLTSFSPPNARPPLTRFLLRVNPVMVLSSDWFNIIAVQAS